MKKKLITIIRQVTYAIFLFAIGCLFFFACQDDDNSRPPVIERVRLSDPSTAESSLEKATLGSTLAIVGRNLASTRAVYLNNYEVSVNAAYATNSYLLVNVPDSVPTIAKDPNVPNELRVVTNFGETTFPFQILPPAPQIQQISNEFVKAGESVTLYGKYFFFVDSVFVPGAPPMTSGLTSSSDGSSLTFTLPQGFDPTQGDVVVHSQSGSSQTSRATKFYTGTGIFENFDDIYPWGWGLNNQTNVTTTSPGNVIAPIDNKFALINMTLPPSWGWSNDKVLDITDWGGAQIFPTAYDAATPASSFDLKMEIAVVGSSLNGVVLQVNFPRENGTFSTNVTLTDFVRSTDGKWYTVTVPLNSLATSGGAKLGTYADVLSNGEGKTHEIQFVIANASVSALATTMAIDNIRIVKVQ
jgi:hypothetical protein